MSPPRVAARVGRTQPSRQPQRARPRAAAGIFSRGASCESVVVCVPAVSPPTRLVPRVETCPMRVKARVKGATGNVFLFYPPGPTRTPASRECPETPASGEVLVRAAPADSHFGEWQGLTRAWRSTEVRARTEHGAVCGCTRLSVLSHESTHNSLSVSTCLARVAQAATADAAFETCLASGGAWARGVVWPLGMRVGKLKSPNFFFRSEASEAVGRAGVVLVCHDGHLPREAEERAQGISPVTSFRSALHSPRKRSFRSA